MLQNNYSIFFVRHGKVSLPYGNDDQVPYKIFSDMGIGKFNPSIERNDNIELINKISTIIPFGKIDNIYVSPAKRCQETAKLINNFNQSHFKKDVTITITKELKEIEFNLKKIYPNNEFFNNKKISDKLFKAMIGGKGCESALDAYKRVKIIFEMLATDNNKISMLITHDFLMRVIEIYIKNRGKSNILFSFNSLKNTKRNLNLSGFATDLQLSSFLPF